MDEKGQAMNTYLQTVGIAVVFCAASAHAAYIDVGTHTLLPNTPDQVVEIRVVSDDPGERAIGFDLSAFLGPSTTTFEEFYDIVTENRPYNGGPAPRFTDVDIVGPLTVFGSNNSGVLEGSHVLAPRFVSASTITRVGDVVADGVLARLTVDTTGVFAEADRDLLFPLSLKAVAPTELLGTVPEAPYGWYLLRGATDYLRPSKITDGHFRIAALPAAGPQSAAVPEPGSAALEIAGLAGVCLLRRFAKRGSLHRRFGDRAAQEVL
jgi:hypothetical protein